MLQDLRYALRTLRQAPGFALAAVCCLALGIGANTTVFSAVNTLLLRPLPYAEGVVLVHLVPRETGDFSGMSYPDFLDLGTASGAFVSAGAYSDETFNLGGVAEPERLRGTRMTASMLPTIGVQPALGRNFRPDEDGRANVVLIGDGLWRRRFAADPDVIGRAITLNGAPFTIVGVLPPKMRFPESSDLWLPIEPGEEAAQRTWRNYEVLGRLAPNVSLEQARVRVAAFVARQAKAYPDAHGDVTGWVRPFREQVATEVRPMMRIMLGAVAFVLLIACANVASLMLTRSTGRQREIGVRLALGASRRRIVRQLLIEASLLAAAGGALGLLLGTWGMAAIARSLPSEDMPFWMEFRTDRAVVLMTMAAALGSVLLFALAPALRASAPSLTRVLKDGGTRGVSASARMGRARGALVVGQLALSCVLLAGAGLLMRGFLKMQNAADLGFDARGVLTFQTSLQGDRYAGDTARAQAYAALVSRLEALPGVVRAGVVSQLPIGSCCGSTVYMRADQRLAPRDAPASLISSVSMHYFGAMGVRLLAGRAFGAQDTPGSAPVVIVNRTLAERTWPGADPLARQVRLDPTDSAVYTVVGVVADVKQRQLTDAPRPQLYVPHAQSPWRSMTVVVRTAGDPSAVTASARAALRAIDPDLPVYRLLTMRDVVDRRNFQARVYSQMLAVFAVAAMALAAIGLYGVVSYGAAQRSHELAVRTALGARPGDLLRLVAGGGTRLAVLGVAIGVPSAMLVARLLRGVLYGVSAADPVTFVGVPLLLAAVALVASVVPARRAAQVEPAAALRAD